MSDVYIVSAARTPIGNFNGTLSKVPASDLGAIVVKEVLNRANTNAADVNEVILGQTLTAAAGQNPARQASIKAGIPQDVPAFGCNMLCGSGLKSVYLGFQSIKSGESNVVVCGGQESMTLAPHAVQLRAGVKLGSTNLTDTMLNDGLTDAFSDIHMGITAENCNKKFENTREEQDSYAARSQQLAEAAQKNGYFDAEIVPVPIPSRTGVTLFDKDEFPKHGTTAETLAKLRPCFDKNGSVTAGNASGLNDSAAAVLLMSHAEAQKRGATPLARIVAFGQAGVDPNFMGMGASSAVQIVLKKAGWNKDEVDLYELNEAFAAVSLSVNKELNIDESKININGGAIALGHPIGASGCRVLVTLIYALKRTGGRKGVASLCVGGGMGIAIAIELL
ncbi:acetyl-CoA acetyltransferase, cytosolic [Contarinia nasturtii]|uniref:acetyl-CoA acetyltransferase, cytosolic n=1 Tax=Contarinia nasturtii TaxID=265458 RepID=UPI0012D3A8F0|nr:acetyl-CoA acetyltransferase, cytosolic [Contarinia nasturtii]